MRTPGAVDLFAGHDDARTNIGFPDVNDSLTDTSCGIPDQIRQNMSVEQIATNSDAHKSTGSGGASTIAEKSTSIGSHGRKQIQQRVPFNRFYDQAVTLATALSDFANLPGGIPIKPNNETLGAIAASGASGEDDIAIAMAGVAEFVSG